MFTDYPQKNFTYKYIWVGRKRKHDKRKIFKINSSGEYVTLIHTCNHWTNLYLEIFHDFSTELQDMSQVAISKFHSDT